MTHHSHTGDLPMFSLMLSLLFMPILGMFHMTCTFFVQPRTYCSIFFQTCVNTKTFKRKHILQSIINWKNPLVYIFNWYSRSEIFAGTPHILLLISFIVLFCPVYSRKKRNAQKTGLALYKDWFDWGNVDSIVNSIWDFAVQNTSQVYYVCVINFSAAIPRYLWLWILGCLVK